MTQAHDVPIYKMDIKSARLQIQSKYNKKSKTERIGSSEDYCVDTRNNKIKVRAYQPTERKKEGACFVFYHGGGAVLFSIEEYDSICRHLCNLSGACVVSVDYHLAPEYVFPTQVEEAVMAYQWVLDNHELLSVDPEKIAVIGDSFGGYLATVVCIESKIDCYKCPCAEVLLYPRTDYHRDDLESYQLYSKDYGLDQEEMDWYWTNYLPRNCTHDDYRVCPNRSRDLTDMPRAYIYTAECDPLRDEGEEYAAKLIQSGVPTELTRVDGQIHGFIHFWDVLETPRRILEEIASLPVFDNN